MGMAAAKTTLALHLRAVQYMRGGMLPLVKVLDYALDGDLILT